MGVKCECVGCPHHGDTKCGKTNLYLTTDQFDGNPNSAYTLLHPLVDAEAEPWIMCLNCASEALETGNYIIEEVDSQEEI
jgi:hypothetical protein